MTVNGLPFGGLARQVPCVVAVSSLTMFRRLSVPRFASRLGSTSVDGLQKGMFTIGPLFTPDVPCVPGWVFGVLPSGTGWGGRQAEANTAIPRVALIARRRDISASVAASLGIERIDRRFNASQCLSVSVAPRYQSARGASSGREGDRGCKQLGAQDQTKKAAMKPSLPLGPKWLVA